MSKSYTNSPLQIVQHMLNNDPFSQWMGVELEDVREGYCRISCSVSKNMINGFAVTHGGILFSIADTALAFATSTYGYAAYSVDHSISFISKSNENDILTATANCIHRGRNTAVTEVKIVNESEKLLAFLKGTSFISSTAIH